MPGFDKTGPQGQGPRTGKQTGKCVPGNNLRETHSSPRIGLGRRLGNMLGFGTGEGPAGEKGRKFGGGRGRWK